MRTPNFVSRISVFVTLSALAVSTQAAPTGTWSPSTPRTAKAAREHAAAYDPVRNQMLTFGGYDGLSSSATDSILDNAFTLGLAPNPQTWIDQTLLFHRCNPQLRPSRRKRASLAYDPVSDRFFLFGGIAPSSNGLLWQLDMTDPVAPSWCQVPIPGQSEQPYYSTFDTDVRMVYDSARHRLLAIRPTAGVYALSLYSTPQYPNLTWVPVWEGDLTSSTNNFIGPYGYNAVYDSNRDRLLVFGGFKGPAGNGCSTGYKYSTVYGLFLGAPSAWQTVASGAPGTADAGAAFDPAMNRVVVYGGERCKRSSGTINMTSQVNVLSLDPVAPTWSVASATGSPPPNRFAHSVILTPSRDLVVFGGTATGTNTGNFTDTFIFHFTDDTPPEPRARHVAVFDAAYQRMILWGGDNGYRTFRDDVWAMSLPASGTPTWSKLQVQGTPPTGVRGAAAVYDTQRHCIYVHGGATLSNQSNDQLFKLSLTDVPATWSMLSPTGAIPSARMFHSMGYDPTGDKVYLFGGWTGAAQDDSLNDTYEWSPGTGIWTQLNTAHAPEPRYGAVSFFDTNRRRFTIAGGNGSLNEGWIGPAWGLNLSPTVDWATIQGFNGPANLRFASAAFIPSQDRAYVPGGWFNPENQNSNLNHWIYFLFNDPPMGTWGSYPSGSAPNEIIQTSLVYDPIGNRVVRFGGAMCGNRPRFVLDQTNVNNLTWQGVLSTDPYQNVWTLLSPANAVGGGGNKNHRITVGALNPGDWIHAVGGLGSTSVRFTAAGKTAGLRVEIFDVGGRRVRSLSSKNAVDVTWNRADDTGHVVPSGVYFYRAAEGERTASGKVVLTR